MPKVEQSDDPVKLDDSHNGLAGKIKELYYRFKYFAGWWNSYGKKALTAADFLKLMLAYEFRGMTDLSSEQIEQLAHGTTHWFNSRCGKFTAGGICGGVSPNAIFNFLVASQSTRDRVSNALERGLSLGHGTDQAGANLSLAGIIVASIINPSNSEWKRGGVVTSDWISLSHPYMWGNRSLFTIDPPKVLWKWPKDPSPEQDYFMLLDVETSKFMENYRVH